MSLTVTLLMIGVVVTICNAALFGGSRNNNRGFLPALVRRIIENALQGVDIGGGIGDGIGAGGFLSDGGFDDFGSSSIDIGGKELRNHFK